LLSLVTGEHFEKWKGTFWKMYELLKSKTHFTVLELFASIFGRRFCLRRPLIFSIPALVEVSPKLRY
jgi:hypothetical protein